jgi:uncharacterized protein YciI
MFILVLLALCPAVRAWAGGSVGPSAGAPLARTLARDVAMALFPRGQEDAESSRNAKMAALLGGLCKAVGSASETQRLLHEARPMLLEPFEGTPEAGSVYGEASSGLDERVEKYEAAMVERIARVRDAGGEAQAQALALTNMLEYVLDELGFEQTADSDGTADVDDDVVAAKLAAAMAAEREEEEGENGLGRITRLRGGMAAPDGLSWFVKTERFVSHMAFPQIRPHLEAHKEWVAALRAEGRVITSGYRVDADGRPGGGGLMLFAAPSHADAEEFVLADPLVANGCVDYEVAGWVADVGDVALVDGGAWYEREKHSQ